MFGIVRLVPLVNSDTSIVTSMNLQPFNWWNETIKGCCEMSWHLKTPISAFGETYTTFLLVESNTKYLCTAVELENGSGVSTRSPVKGCQSIAGRCLSAFAGVQKRKQSQPPKS
jgi:hypothetical protein